MRICSCTMSHTHSHTLTITCTCCYDEIKGTQDSKIYSHAHSLILSLTLTAWSSDTLFSLRKLVQAPTWAQAASTAVFGQQGHYSKGRGQGSLKWQVFLSLALLATLIAASCSAGVETRRTGTAPFDVHLNPNSGPSGTLSLISHGTLTAIFHSTGLESAELQAHTRSGNCSPFHIPSVSLIMLLFSYCALNMLSVLSPLPS